MADYYSLIARAVAVLEKNSGENRRALYERARAALLAQLRGLTPALDESDITRERLALEESIRKVEAESARKFAETTRAPAAPKVRPGEPQPAEQAIEPRPPERPVEPRRARDLDQEAAPPRRYVNPPAPQKRELRCRAGRSRPCLPPPSRHPRCVRCHHRRRQLRSHRRGLPRARRRPSRKMPPCDTRCAGPRLRDASRWKRAATKRAGSIRSSFPHCPRARRSRRAKSLLRRHRSPIAASVRESPRLSSALSRACSSRKSRDSSRRGSRTRTMSFRSRCWNHRFRWTMRTPRVRPIARRTFPFWKMSIRPACGAGGCPCPAVA